MCSVPPLVICAMSLDVHGLSDTDYDTHSHEHRLFWYERETLLHRHIFFPVLRRTLPLVKVEEAISH